MSGSFEMITDFESVYESYSKEVSLSPFLAGFLEGFFPDFFALAAASAAAAAASFYTIISLTLLISDSLCFSESLVLTNN
jgi:hypothetical protein